MNKNRPLPGSFIKIRLTRCLTYDTMNINQISKYSELISLTLYCQGWWADGRKLETTAPPMFGKELKMTKMDRC